MPGTNEVHKTTKDVSLFSGFNDLLGEKNILFMSGAKITKIQGLYNLEYFQLEIITS